MRLDHVMCGMVDVAQSRAAFERLGFVVTPYSRARMMGGGNALIELRANDPASVNFVELAHMNDPATADRFVRKMLQPGEGIRTLVHLVDDPDDTYEAWTSAGLTVARPTTFRRVTQLATGEAMEFEATVVLPEPGQAAVNFNAYSTTTPDLYRRPDLQAHPNRARHWGAVSACLPDRDVQPTVDLFERIYGERARWAGGAAVLTSGEIEVSFYPRALFAERYAAVPLDGLASHGGGTLTFAADDLAHVAALQREAGVPVEDGDGAVLVPPAHACGLVLEFVTA